MIFTFKIRPRWFPADDDYCRACDKHTAYVMMASGGSYTYPCCDDPGCRGKVESEIRRSVEKEKRRA